MQVFRFWSDLGMQLRDIIDVVFAVKPCIDAVSPLLFLGEYRKNAGTLLRRLNWCCEEIMPSTQATADHMPNGSVVNTVSPMPNTFSSSHYVSEH